MKTLLKILPVLVLMLSLLSCEKKEGPRGLPGPPGPGAVSTEFSLVFNPGEFYELYEGVNDFDSGDALVVYVKSNSAVNGNYFWTQIPAIVNGENQAIQMWPAFNEEVGLLYIHTSALDGSEESPWQNASVLFYFKAVVIKEKAMQNNPELDVSNYEEVRQTFNLEPDNHEATR